MISKNYLDATKHPSDDKKILKLGQLRRNKKSTAQIFDRAIDKSKQFL